MGRINLRISDEVAKRFRAHVDDNKLVLCDAAETALCEYLERHVGK
jgi:hypothetical protein